MHETRKQWLEFVFPSMGRLRMAAKDDATGINPEDWTQVQSAVNELREALEEMDAIMDDVE